MNTAATALHGFSLPVFSSIRGNHPLPFTSLLYLAFQLSTLNFQLPLSQSDSQPPSTTPSHNGTFTE